MAVGEAGIDIDNALVARLSTRMDSATVLWWKVEELTGILARRVLVLRVRRPCIG